MSQMFRLLFPAVSGPVGNDWADYVEIWYALGDPLVTAYSVFRGGVSLHVRTYRDTPKPRFCISNCLADCVQIWYVGWGSLTKCLQQVIGRVYLHVRTCAPLFHKCFACCYSVTVGPIELKFGMHLGIH